jgi:hypothetical protein
VFQCLHCVFFSMHATKYLPTLMFSKSCHNILFSKVYSTLIFRKESLTPINGYGQEAILNLITVWYKLAKITSDPKVVVFREIIHVTLGYYSIYSDYPELYNKLFYIEENIRLNVVKSSGYILTDREELQHAILIELLVFLARKYN